MARHLSSYKHPFSDNLDRSKHGHSIRGNRTREYISWANLKIRCYKKNHPYYPDYGGRGITVCERWLNSFENFLSDMGRCPDGHTIDRINNDGNYEPSNCRWATKVEQASNRKSNRVLTFNGKTQIAKRWAEELGIGYQTLIFRLKSGWPVERALTAKVQYYHHE